MSKKNSIPFHWYEIVKAAQNDSNQALQETIPHPGKKSEFLERLDANHSVEKAAVQVSEIFEMVRRRLNVHEIAYQLGISRNGVYARLQGHGLDPGILKAFRNDENITDYEVLLLTQKQDLRDALIRVCNSSAPPEENEPTLLGGGIG